MRFSDVDHRLPPQRCPLCDHRLDAASALDSDAAPTPGDLTVCISCASPLVFGPLPLLPLRPVSFLDYCFWEFEDWQLMNFTAFMIGRDNIPEELVRRVMQIATQATPPLNPGRREPGEAVH